MGVMLIEKSLPLNYIKESGERSDGKHYLGKLAGVGADFMHPTRNNRRYPYELWVNVENSPDFKEGMETLTIFGEADHPETRVDTSIKEIAIVLTKFEIRKSEGIVYVEFDILDTPNGRILKELLDYGSQIGVSSRGIGDEIVENGETIIDPDTYIFYGFDAVVMPAVAKARPSVVEALDRNLIESFSKEIENSSTKGELQSIKRIVESANLSILDSVKESLDKKLEQVNLGEDISVHKNSEILLQKIKKLENKLSADNIRISKLMSQLKETQSNSRIIRRSLQEKIKTITSLEDDIYEASVQSLITDETINRIKAENNKLTEENKCLTSRIKVLEKSNFSNREKYNRKLGLTESTYKSEIEIMAKNKLSMEDKINKLTSQVSKLKSDKLILENKSNNRIKNLEARLNQAKIVIEKSNHEYLKLRCLETGINIETVKRLLPDNYTFDDINKIVSELSDRKTRLDKVPIVFSPRNAIIKESSLRNISDEDRQTLSILNKTLN